ncbi:hypothetical protein [Phytohabitans suffuscus]|nr:hypothetical protein [Phytohabitans suffuscus]
MRMTRKRRIGPDQAERLLATGHDPAHPELDRLLAAATAPPRPHELAGLDAALAAFEEAGRTRRPAPARQRWRVLRPLAAAAATAAVLVGGVAVAAEIGYLPGTDRPAAHEQLGSRAAPPSTAESGHGTASAPAGTVEPTHSLPVTPGGTAIERLCRGWDDRRHKGRPMKPDDLRELAAAAGGEDRIAAFCAPRLRPPGNGQAPPNSPPSATHPSPTLADDGDDDDQGEDGDEQAAARNKKKKKEDE